MRAYIPSYDMIAPKTLAEALHIFSAEPGVWQPFAGGTDLMVLFESGKLTQKKFLSIWQLNELRGISEEATEISVGAVTSFAQIRVSPVMQKLFPLLCQAARLIGAPAIQNRASIGGNIMNASPAGDSLPVLLVYDASVELASADGRRWVRYSEFHTGYKKKVAQPNELLVRVCLPKAASWTRQYFRKVGTRAAQAISKLCMAGLIRIKDGKVEDCRIAMGSVAPTPLRCTQTEATLLGQVLTPAVVRKASQVLERELSPVDDIRSSAQYRQTVAKNLLNEFLTSL